MKKSLIALAVVGAFASAASAQSNVTLYGIADIGGGYTDRGGNTDGYMQVFSGVQSTSRFGIRGSEDLGGGLKAIFNMEAGVNYDTGAADATFFQRRTIVGLQTGLGEIRLGRDYTPGFSAAGATDVMGYGLMGNWLTFTAQGLASSALQTQFGLSDAEAATIAGQGLTNGITTRASNGLHYTSPSFGNTKCAAVPAPTECGIFDGGLTVRAMYATGESDGLSAPESAGDMWGGAVVWKGGALTLQGYYQNTEFGAYNVVTAGNTVSGEKDEYGAGFQFVFGMFRIAGNWGVVETDFGNANVTVEKEGFGLGAGMKLGAGELLVNFITQEFDSNLAAGITPKADTWGIAYVHPMSKRTNIYATWGQTSNSDGASVGLNYSQASVAAAGANEDPMAFAIGVRHLF